MSTTLDNLLIQDPDYSDSKFRSKVENEFVKIKLATVTGKIERIQHFVNADVYSKIEQKVQNDINNNRIQMYDELNVSDVKILQIEELEDRFKITVNVHSKALDYFLDRETRRFLSGNNSYRTEKDSIVVFEKIKNNKKMGSARSCPFCGANLDINNTGICNFCGSTFPLENYDWVITQFDM